MHLCMLTSILFTVFDYYNAYIVCYVGILCPYQVNSFIQSLRHSSNSVVFLSDMNQLSYHNCLRFSLLPPYIEQCNVMSCQTATIILHVLYISLKAPINNTSFPVEGLANKQRRKYMKQRPITTSRYRVCREVSQLNNTHLSLQTHVASLELELHIKGALLELENTNCPSSTRETFVPFRSKKEESQSTHEILDDPQGVA